jgi:hypothetical protein
MPMLDPEIFVFEEKSLHACSGGRRRRSNTHSFPSLRSTAGVEAGVLDGLSLNKPDMALWPPPELRVSLVHSFAKDQSEGRGPGVRVVN